MNCNKRFLEYKAYQLRKLSLIMTAMAGSGHPTSCLSAADIVAALFFYAMTLILKIFQILIMIDLFYQKGMQHLFYMQHGKRWVY